MDIKVTQILFQIVNFSVVVGALTYLLYKPVLKIFEERTRRIEEGQKAAEEALKSREELDKMKDEMQTALKKERAQVLKKAQEEAVEEGKKILAQAKQEALAESAKYVKKWETEKAALVSDLNQELVSAVIAATEKVISEKISKSDEKLVEAELTTILKTI